jgi:hypothetical protein
LIVFKSLTENGAKSLWQLAELRAKSPFSDHLNIPGYKCRKGACQWTSSAGDELLLLFLLLCWADHADDGATWLKRWIHGRWDIAELLGKLSAWGIVLNSSRALGAEAWHGMAEMRWALSRRFPGAIGGLYPRFCWWPRLFHHLHLKIPYDPMNPNISNILNWMFFFGPQAGIFLICYSS